MYLSFRSSCPSWSKWNRIFPCRKRRGKAKYRKRRRFRPNRQWNCLKKSRCLAIWQCNCSNIKVDEKVTSGNGWLEHSWEKSKLSLWYKCFEMKSLNTHSHWIYPSKHLRATRGQMKMYASHIARHMRVEENLCLLPQTRSSALQQRLFCRLLEFFHVAEGGSGKVDYFPFEGEGLYTVFSTQVCLDHSHNSNFKIRISVSKCSQYRSYNQNSLANF